jgi:hypothetical protein
VKSATKTASREIRRIPADDLLRLEVMASSLFAWEHRGPDAVRSMIWYLGHDLKAR